MNQLESRIRNIPPPKKAIFNGAMNSVRLVLVALQLIVMWQIWFRPDMAFVAGSWMAQNLGSAQLITTAASIGAICVILDVGGLRRMRLQ